MKNLKFRTPVVCQNGHKAYWYFELRKDEEFARIKNFGVNNKDNCDCIKSGYAEGWGRNGEDEQYTGLKDKNEKEIYEGDLFKCNYCSEDLFQIYYENKGARFNIRLVRGKGCGNDHCVSIISLTRSEIIGNIYKNPELLK